MSTTKLRCCIRVICILACLSVTAFCQSVSSVRTVGPEPALQFGNPPTGVSLCAYGEYVRSAASYFGGTCPNFIKGDNTRMMDATDTSESFTYLPFSDVQKYIVRLTQNGVSNQKAVTPFNSTSGDISYGFNMADPAFVSYLLDTYVPYDLIPRGPNAKNNIPTDAAHPTYIEIDAFGTNYNHYGVLDNYVTPTSWTSSGVTWDLPYPQTANAWNQGWKAFFAYAKANHPEIRLSPHACSMSDWSIFPDLYADVPSLMKE